MRLVASACFCVVAFILLGCVDPVSSANSDPDPFGVNSIQYKWRQLGFASDKAIVALVCSGDGNIVLAATQQGNIYRSADAGLSWAPITALGGRVWSAVAISADGNKALACSAEYSTSYYPGSHSYTFSGHLFSSSDGGLTWAEHAELGGQAWQSLASSSDGSIQFASCYPGYTSGLYPTTNESRLYKSVDGGTSWSKLGQDGGNSMACSPDGSKVFIAATGQFGDRVSGTVGGGLKISTNGGLVFGNAGSFPSTYWKTALVSADGQRLVAADQGSVYRSVNGGATWSGQLAKSVGLVAGDSSLNYLLNSTGLMNSSRNNGSNWAKETNAGSHNFTLVSMTPDSKRAYAAAIDNGIPVLFRADQ